MSLTHIDLFSGIGGFALAAHWAGFETTVFCEKDEFCHKVLHKHWPKVPIVEDINEFNGQQYSGATLLTGGFPCQPFSVAGKQRGKDDDRYLWPEMLRVISEVRPTWVVAENVTGVIKLALDQTLSDLEGEGYETITFNIPACAVNAEHKRERIWLVANSKSVRLNNGNDSLFNYAKTNSTTRGMETRKWVGDEPAICRMVNGISFRLDRIRGLGNAIVPQVAYQILEKIANIELGIQHDNTI